MKVLCLSLFATFCVLSSFGQNSPEPNPGQAAPVSPLFLSADRAEQASAEALYRGRGRAEVNCARLKRQRTFGAVMTGIGGGLLASGIAMAVVGTHSINNDMVYNAVWGGYVNNAPPGAYALRNAGIACSLLGVASLAIGIPNLVVGSIRYRRNCGGFYDRYHERERERSSMQISTNGSSLALNF